jgi:hypothetical protein
MERASSCETSVNFQRTTRRHVPEDRSLVNTLFSNNFSHVVHPYKARAQKALIVSAIGPVLSTDLALVQLTLSLEGRTVYRWFAFFLPALSRLFHISSFLYVTSKDKNKTRLGKDRAGIHVVLACVLCTVTCLIPVVRSLALSCRKLNVALKQPLFCYLTFCKRRKKSCVFFEDLLGYHTQFQNLILMRPGSLQPYKFVRPC